MLSRDHKEFCLVVFDDSLNLEAHNNGLNNRMNMLMQSWVTLLTHYSQQNQNKTKNLPPPLKKC